MIHRRCLSGPLLAVALVLAAAGCGKKMVKVEGKVFLDDKPLDGATVTFQPEDGKGQPATGFTGDDGVFHLTTYTTGDGARPGDYKVVVTRSSVDDQSRAPVNPQKPESMKEATKQMMKLMHQPARPSQKTPKTVPAQYADSSKTPLKARVPADGPVELRLRSKGGS